MTKKFLWFVIMSSLCTIPMGIFSGCNPIQPLQDSHPEVTKFFIDCTGCVPPEPEGEGEGETPVEGEPQPEEGEPIYTLSVSPTYHTGPFNGGSFTLSIRTDASWIARSNASWATISQTSGTGNRDITVTYIANTGGARTTTLIITGRNSQPNSVTVTISQEAAPPTLAVTPSQRNVSSQAGQTSFTISTTVAWQATSPQSWVQLVPASGTGTASLQVNYDENVGRARTASIIINAPAANPQSITVTLAQAAYVPPSLAVSPASRSVSAAAGQTTFSIATTATWEAISNVAWATVSPPTGAGSSVLTVNYEANTGGQRTASITIRGTGGGTAPASVTVTVVQAAATPPALSVTPSSRTIGFEGGDVSFTISTTAAWTASSNAPWASVSPGSGTGSTKLTVTCEANTGTQRTATVTITGSGTSPASVSVTITQSAYAPPILSVTPAERSVANTAGSTTFTVSTLVSWQAASNVYWATVSPLNGSGNGTLTVNYLANPGPERTAAITVTGTPTTAPPSVTVTVRQAGS